MADQDCSHREHEMRGHNAYGQYFELVGDSGVAKWEFCATESARRNTESETPDLMAALRASLDNAKRKRESRVVTPPTCPRSATQGTENNQ